VKNLESRVKRLEKQLTAVDRHEVFLCHSEEEAAQLLKNFKHEYPEQPDPMILLVTFVAPGDLEKENEKNV